MLDFCEWVVASGQHDPRCLTTIVWQKKNGKQVESRKWNKSLFTQMVGSSVGSVGSNSFVVGVIYENVFIKIRVHEFLVFSIATSSDTVSVVGGIDRMI